MLGLGGNVLQAICTTNFESKVSKCALAKHALELHVFPVHRPSRMGELD